MLSGNDGGGSTTGPSPEDIWEQHLEARYEVCQRQKIEGLFVEIVEMTTKICPEKGQQDIDPDCKPIDVNGKRGRVIIFLQWLHAYIIHTLDGYWVSIPEENLLIWPVPKPREGGWDICWPSAPLDVPIFAVELLTNLARQGYTTVQAIVNDRRREEALESARHLTEWTTPRVELMQDFLGRGGRAKVAVRKSRPGTVPAGREAHGGHTEGTQDGRAGARPRACSSLDRCCLELSNIFTVLRPITDDSLGIELHSLTQELVWLPFEDGQEERTLSKGRISESDVHSGDLEEHLSFLQRRKLCLLYLVCGAIDVSLCPKEELGMRAVTIPMEGSRLIVFRHDFMSFTFTPRGDRPFLVLQAWTLESPPQLEIKQVMGDWVSRSRIRGIRSGPVEPPGNQVNVSSVLTKMPGSSRCAMKFWTMLLEGCDAQATVPIHRFDVDAYHAEHEGCPQGRPMSFHGAFCSDRDIFSFDNTIFDVSVQEATYMAPAQRIVLKCGLQCLEMAGFQKNNLEDQVCGIFVGDTGSDWYLDLENYAGCPFSEYEQQSLSKITTANRLAKTLGIKGPVMTLDTACSSSLVATDLAMNALRASLPFRFQDREAAETLQTALVIGVSTIVAPQTYVTLNDLMMLSTKGRCLSFDASRDGYARGEGCGAIYLSTGTYSFDRLAVIVGSATNQEGRSATLTAPNGPSQTRCIWDSLEAAAVQSGEVSMMECHSTGTPLGDAIEVVVLRKVIGPRSMPLPCTSAKSHIGHLEAGAGLAGLIKSVVMLLHSSLTPNCHVRSVDGSLGSEGFPVLFETESVDTRLNSGVSGVSSFGFGGTNAHADIWAECREGPRATGRLDSLNLDQVQVECPITMGTIDYLTGEPAKVPTCKKYNSDILREEFSLYDTSAHYYSGSYRFRSHSLYEDDDKYLPPFTKVYIRGTWSGWKTMEEMNLQNDGWYTATIVLGECRYELFHLCLDADKRREIYPALSNASESTWAFGPDNQRKGRNWIVDGRDEEVPSGTPYKVRFKWAQDRILLIWDRAPMDFAKQVKKYDHMYSIVGTFTEWEPQDLEKSADDKDTWEFKLTVSKRGQELFQFVRDRDFNQAIYPAKPNTTKMSIPVRGPDELGHGKNWRIRGPPGDGVVIRLRIVEAQVSVTVTSDAKGTKAWYSAQGWNRREYFLAGNFNGWVCIPMTMDPVRPGVFKAVGCVGDKFDVVKTGYLAEFQILIDEDFDRGYYPQLNGAGSGQSIVCGPDHRGSGKHFLVKSSCMPCRAFEVCFDLTFMDRRRMVTWTLVVDDRDAAPEIE